LQWVAAKRGIAIAARGDPYLADVAQARARFEAADYVVLPNPVLADYARDLPNASILEPLAAELVADPQVRLVGGDAGLPRYFVFAHRHPRRGAGTPVIRLAGVPLSITGL